MTEDLSPTPAAGKADPDVVATIEQATDALLPVVVDLGSSSFEAQLFTIERDGDPRVVLHPIAAQALPLGHRGLLTLSSASPSQAWSIRCADIAHAGPQHASIRLAGMRFEHRELAPELVRTSDLLVLVVPGGIHDGTDYVFPITRIGPDSCEVRCSTAFNEGAVLPAVEIIGDRRLLRTATAQVTRTTPLHGSDGTRAFSCTLTLAERDEPGPSAGEAQHDLVTAPDEVKKLLKIAAMRQTELWLELPGVPRARGRFLDVAADHAVIELETAAARSWIASRRTGRISIELFWIPHELDVRALDGDGPRLRISLPLILRRRRRHRRDARMEVPEGYGVELRYRHPVTGFVSCHSVVGISFYGVSFRIDAHGSVLWQGLPLEQAQLVWGERLVSLGDLIVDAVDSDERGPVCRAFTQDSRLVDNHDLIDLLAALAHPTLRVHDGSNFHMLHQIYLKAGLFGPHMVRNLAPIYDEVSNNWRILHEDARDMIRTFVNGPEDAPDAAVSVLRAWEAGWVAQHFVDASTERFGATGKLQFAYLDHLIPRPDGRYMVFFVKDDNPVMNQYFKRFFESTGTAEALSCTAVELWLRGDCSLPAAYLDPALSVAACSPSEELTVCHAAQRAFGAPAAAAISMVPGQLHIPDTHERFARAGLERSRDCVLVKRAGRIAYAVLEERSSPGINLTWMLNAAWIVPVHPELDVDGQALARALQVVSERPAQSATGERFLNLPPGLDDGVLARYGFAREAKLRFYVLNRAGMHRYIHYNAVRYGEVEAMMLKRERKKKT